MKFPSFSGIFQRSWDPGMRDLCRTVYRYNSHTDNRARLDLSDPGKFFSVYVPIRAIDSLFLKYAVAALSAKHLGRVKGAKSITGGGIFTNPATTEIYPNSSRVDWFLKGANYYYLAVSNMQTVGTETYGSLHTSAVLGSPFEIVDQLLKLLPQSGFDELATAGFTRKIEDLMAATAILYMYKILDANEVDSHSYVTQRPFWFLCWTG